MSKKILTLDNVPVINKKIGKIDTIEKLKASTIYSLGDVVEVLGFHAKGDGSHHYRQKVDGTYTGEDAIDCVDGTKWKIIHNGEVNVSWFGAKPINSDCSILKKVLSVTDIITLDCNSFEFTVTDNDKNLDFSGRSFFFFYKQIKNVNLVGDVSLTNYTTTNTLGSDKIIENITVTGNLKLSSWRSVYKNIKVSENLFLEGGDTPDANWWGCGWNKFEKIYVGKGLITNIYYGWVNLNNFVSCRFGYIHCFNKEITPNIKDRVLDYHLNKFDSCEIYSSEDLCVVQNNTKFSILIEQDCKGSNYFDNLYNETTVRAYKGKLNIKGLHTAGKQVVYSSDVVLESVSRVSDTSTVSTGAMSTDILYNCWNDTKVEEGGVYIPKVYFVPYNSSAVNEDLTEPSGLGRKLTVRLASYSQFQLLPNTTGNIAIFVKKTESDVVSWICEDKDGKEMYNILNEVLYPNGWSLFTFKNVFKVRAYNNSSTIKQLTISNSSCSVGDSVMTPISNGTYKSSVSIIALDTPYYTYKMQQQGIYDDYVAYRDELHEYESSQASDDTMLLPVLHEPVVPESVRTFAEKYKLI